MSCFRTGETMRNQLLVGSAVAAVFATGLGCSTVDTRAVAKDRIGEGLTYFLPKRRAKFIATRSVLDPKEIKEALAKAEKAKASAEETAKGKADVLKTEQALFDKLKKEEQQLEESLIRLGRAKADSALAAEALTAISATVAGLKDQLREAQMGGGGCVYAYSAKLELLPAEADPTYRFVMAPNHQPFRDDDQKLTVQANGLLSSANVVATDRTGDILVELAGAIAGIQAKDTTVMSVLNTLPPAASCDQKLKTFQYIFDPASADVGTLNARLKAAEFPFRITSDGTSIDPKPPIASEHAKKGVINTDPEPRGEQDIVDEFVNRHKGDIFYRTSAPVVLTVFQCVVDVKCGEDPKEAPIGAQPIDAVLVLLPQAGSVSYVPMKSSAFVRTVNDVQFEEGAIKSWNATRPSEALEFVRLPVKILKSVLEVPATIFSLRIDVNSKEKALADSQRAEIEAAARLRDLKDCIATHTAQPVTEVTEVADDQPTSDVMSCFPE